MSKKKASGNTMTLKDFHGGSIPSDLPLPSAPGLAVRHPDRPGYDRPAPWGNQIGRAETRPRPHTSPATRHLDDKAPFLPHTANIGRNFDEDERKPLDGGSAPRRTVSDDSVRPAPLVARPLRKEVEPSWSAPNAVSKLAHASPLDKVSSGRWQSKPHPADAEVESFEGYAQVPPIGDAKERNAAGYRERGQPDRSAGKLGGGADLQTLTSSEPSERPKLKLLPRTKPLESLEHPVVEPIQATETRTDQFHEGHGILNPVVSGSVSSESEKPVVERPKLNLKPRSQPVEPLDGSVEGERNLLFGGARPRELVLKERGIDDAVIIQDPAQQTERVEHPTPRAERVSGHANTSRYSERTENPARDPRIGTKSERRENEARAENPGVDQRIGKRPERRDQQIDHERVDTQRRNWRGVDSRRNNRETEKQPQQQPERAPSPETWRRPVDEPKQSSVDSAGPRYGKAASAVELAASFSKSSVSDPTDRTSGQRNLPGRAQSQAPFSRLAGPTPRSQHQINGY